MISSDIMTSMDTENEADTWEAESNWRERRGIAAPATVWPRKWEAKPQPKTTWVEAWGDAGYEGGHWVSA